MNLGEMPLPVAQRIGWFVEKGCGLSRKFLFQSSRWYLSVPGDARAPGMVQLQRWLVMSGGLSCRIPWEGLQPSLGHHPRWVRVLIA